MVKYSATPEDPEKACKVRGNNVKASYKNTRETVHAIRKLTVSKAIRYMQDVIDKKDIIPFRRHNGGVGRHAQLKKYKTSQGRWPEKSCAAVKNLLHQLKINGERINIGPDKMVITHASVNRAPQRRRRTYRAHGRINRFNSHPCHIQLIASAKEDEVPKGTGKKSKISHKTNLRSGDTAA